jgi:hypothetical protein
MHSMPMWRCPHCGTPQAETSRCWVCKRSSTSCGTCRHFRRSIAGQLGYCGLDARRKPLIGDELRGCWEAGASFESPTSRPVREFVPLRPRLDFVPVEPARKRRPAPAEPAAGLPAPNATAGESLPGFWNDEA